MSESRNERLAELETAVEEFTELLDRLLNDGVYKDQALTSLGLTSKYAAKSIIYQTP